MQDAAGQLRKSPYQFSGIGSQSPLLWLIRGYAVLDGPTMPIVAGSEDAEPNDTYVPQLVASAKAAVEVRFLWMQGTNICSQQSPAPHSHFAWKQERLT